MSEKVSSDIWFAELKTVILPSYYPKRVISNNNCRKPFLELVSLYFSKIVMLQRLKIVIISPFSVEYILFFSEIEMVIITWQEVFASTILICNHTRD